jgi:hypothetical protein
VDWGTYPILTFSDAPEMEIAGLPALGAGEPSTVTTAPAVANAVFDATGAQVYACARCRLRRREYEGRCFRAETGCKEFASSLSRYPCNTIASCRRVDQLVRNRSQWAIMDSWHHGLVLTGY